MRILLTALTGLLIGSGAIAAEFGIGEEIFRSANWTVRLTPDAMTGAKSCTGAYQGQYYVQLTDDALFVSLARSGGLRAYSVQFDDEAAGAERPSNDHENAIQSVALMGDELARVLKSKRLRLNITTAGGRPQMEDLDLSDIGPAHTAVRGARCTGPAVAAPAAQETTVFDLPAGTNVTSVTPAPDGKVWFTAVRPGAVGILDPANGNVRMIPFPQNASPREVVFDKAGRAWVTDTGLAAVVGIDANSDSLKTWPLPKDLGRPSFNAAAFDHDGLLWFTGAGANGEYGRLNTATGEVNAWKPPQGRYTFGISVTPGNEVWYVSVVPSYYAQVDRATGASKVFEPPYPHTEPHRLRSDSKGDIWIDEWTIGSLIRYSPKSSEWKIWPLPGQKPPHGSGLYIDDKDVVWVINRGSSTTYGFDATTEKYVAAVADTQPWANARILGRPGELWIAEAATGKLVRVKTGAIKTASR